MAGLEPFLGMPDRRAPEFVGGKNLHLVIDDMKIDGLWRLAFQDQQIVPGVLQLGAELPARVGAGNGTGQGALRYDRIASRGRRHGAREWPGREDEDIFRAHGIRAGIHHFPKVLCREPALAQILLRPLHVERLDGARPVAQVHSQNLALPAHIPLSSGNSVRDLICVQA